MDGAIERLFVSIPGDDTLEMPARSVSSSRAAEDISDVRADRGHLVKLSSVVLVNGYGAQAIPDYLALSGYEVFNIGHGLGARRRPFGVVYLVRQILLDHVRDSLGRPGEVGRRVLAGRGEGVVPCVRAAVDEVGNE